MMYVVLRPIFISQGPNDYRVDWSVGPGIAANSPKEALEIAKGAGHLIPIIAKMITPEVIH